MLIALTVMFGYLGVYRFYKRQYIKGILYIFTYGFFGLGWFIDILLAIKDTIENTKRKQEEAEAEKHLHSLEDQIEIEKLKNQLMEEKLNNMQNETLQCEYCNSLNYSDSLKCANCGAKLKQ